MARIPIRNNETQFSAWNTCRFLAEIHVKLCCVNKSLDSGWPVPRLTVATYLLISLQFSIGKVSLLTFCINYTGIHRAVSRDFGQNQENTHSPFQTSYNVNSINNNSLTVKLMIHISAAVESHNAHHGCCWTSYYTHQMLKNLILNTTDVAEPHHTPLRCWRTT